MVRGRRVRVAGALALLAALCLVVVALACPCAAANERQPAQPPNKQCAGEACEAPPAGPGPEELKYAKQQQQQQPDGSEEAERPRRRHRERGPGLRISNRIYLIAGLVVLFLLWNIFKVHQRKQLRQDLKLPARRGRAAYGRKGGYVADLHAEREAAELRRKLTETERKLAAMVQGLGALSAKVDREAGRPSGLAQQLRQQRQGAGDGPRRRTTNLDSVSAEDRTHQQTRARRARREYERAVALDPDSD